MTKHVMIAMSNPSDPSAEEEFNRWYDEEHIPDVLRVGGIRRAVRYRLADAQLRDDAPFQYLAIFTAVLVIYFAISYPASRGVA